MPVDYNSTDPWNDPYNPWPAFYQISLSGNVINDVGTPIAVNTVLRMLLFDPNIDDNYSVYYETVPAVYDNSYCAVYGYRNTAAASPFWAIQIGFDDPFKAFNNTLQRNIPYILNQSQIGDWIPDTGSGLGNIILKPVIAAVTPWERRRIAGGAQ